MAGDEPQQPNSATSLCTAERLNLDRPAPSGLPRREPPMEQRGKPLSRQARLQLSRLTAPIKANPS